MLRNGLPSTVSSVVLKTANNINRQHAANLVQSLACGKLGVLSNDVFFIFKFLRVLG